jgi:hypothetical protein
LKDLIGAVNTLGDRLGGKLDTMIEKQDQMLESKIRCWESKIRCSICSRICYTRLESPEKI